MNAKSQLSDTTIPDLKLQASTISQDPLQFLQHLWEGVSYGIFVLDVLDQGKDFRYIAFNPAIARTSPMPVEQLLGKTVTEALPQEMATHYHQYYSQCVQSKQSISFEEQFCYNAQTSWWRLTVDPICNDNNQITQLLVTAIDISDRIALETKYKQAEAELKKSQQRFQTLCESTPTIAIQGYDRNRRVIFWNKASVALYGYSAAEALGKPLEDLIIPSETKEWVVEAVDNWMTRGQTIPPGEIQLQHNDGSSVFVYSNYVLLNNGDDQPEMYCLDIDLSDRKAAEISRRQSQQQLELALRSAQMGVWSWDVATHVMTWTTEAEKVFGLEPGTFGGTLQAFVDRLHPDELERVNLALQRALKGEEKYYIEYRSIFPDGTVHWIEAHGDVLRDDQGNPQSMIGVVKDISDRKQAEKEQARLLAILEATSDFIGTASPNGQVLYLNQSARQMLGLTPEEAITDRNITQSHPTWVNQIIANESLPETTQSGRWMGETAILGVDREIPVSQLILSHRSETGEIEYFSTIARDISDRKQQENALRFIVEGTASKTGDEFFQACVQHLAEILQVQYAFVTELVDQTFNQSRMLSLWTGERFVEPYVFNLAGTPCRVVFEKNWGIFAEGLQTYFPEADGLVTLGAESYLGVVIVNSQGKAIGNLGIIDTKPLTDNLDIAQSILKLFAARVGAEMERNAAQMKLQEQEQFLRSVYEGADQPIFVIDVLPDNEFCYMDWNAAAEAVSGMSSQQARGKTPEEIFGAAGGQLVRQRLQACLDSKQPIRFEECLTFNGEEFDWLTIINPIQDSHGQIYRFIGTAFNITDRKAAERKLRQSEQKYHQILDAITDMVLVKGPQSRIVWANKAFRDYYGMTNEQLQDLIDAPFNQPDYTLQYIRDDAYVFETGNTLEIEEPVTRYDGTVRIFNTIKSLIRNEAGEKILTVGVSRDISDRKAAETALKEYANSQTLLNQLANQIRHSLDLDIVIETTIESIRDLLNIDTCSFAWYIPNAQPPTWEVVQEAQLEQFPSALGCYPVTLVGPVDHLVFEHETIQIDDVKQYPEPIHREFLQSLHCQSEILLPIHTHSNRIGIIICFHCQQIRPWKDSEVELLKAVRDQLAIAIDQAELYAESRAKSHKLRKTLKELKRTQAQIVQAEKMSSLGQLVAGIAHEINNPVNFIHANIIHAGEYAQDLLDLIALYQAEYPQPSDLIMEKLEEIDLDFLKQDLSKLLNSMQYGTERIREIVKSLRLFSRLDEAEFKPIDLHESIDSTLMILQNRLNPTPERAEIKIIKDYGNLPQVECFAGQLNQVFMNILTNAIDALEENDRKRSRDEQKQQPSLIRIVTKIIANSDISIRIIDNGIGIPSKIKEKIFDPFFTTKPVGKGTGMGMSISYQIIVEKHKGTLECFSNPEKGTEFVIKIPIQQNQKT